MRNKILVLQYLFLFLYTTLHADTTVNIKEAFDFRDNSWKTIEFFINNKGSDKVRIFTTLEDVTKIYRASYVNGAICHYIKGGE